MAKSSSALDNLARWRTKRGNIPFTFKLPERTFAPHGSSRISRHIYTFFCMLFTISSARINNWLGQTPKDGFSARIRFYHLPNNRRLRRYTATSIPFAALSGRIRYYRNNAFTGPVSSASVSLTEHARARLPVTKPVRTRTYAAIEEAFYANGREPASLAPDSIPGVIALIRSKGRSGRKVAGYRGTSSNRWRV